MRAALFDVKLRTTIHCKKKRRKEKILNKSRQFLKKKEKKYIGCYNEMDGTDIDERQKENVIIYEYR